MIVEFLINNVLYKAILFIANIIALAPDVSLNSALSSSLSQISPYYSAIDPIFPIGTLLSILVIELGFIGAYFLYKLIRWAYIKIPGIS